MSLTSPTWLPLTGINRSTPLGCTGLEGVDALRAQRMLMPVTGAESWTVVDDDLVTVGDVERYLAHLAAIERSPNTVRAYAHSLALWCTFLQQRAVERTRAEIDDVAEFVRWLRAPASNVIVLHELGRAAFGGDGQPASGCCVRLL